MKVEIKGLDKAREALREMSDSIGELSAAAAYSAAALQKMNITASAMATNPRLPMDYLKRLNDYGSGSYRYRRLYEGNWGDYYQTHREDGSHKSGDRVALEREMEVARAKDMHIGNAGDKVEVYVDGQKFDGYVYSVRLDAHTEMYDKACWGDTVTTHVEGPTEVTGTMNFVVSSQSLDEREEPERGHKKDPGVIYDAPWTLEKLAEMFRNQDHSLVRLDAAGITREMVELIRNDFNKFLDDRIWHWSGVSSLDNLGLDLSDSDVVEDTNMKKVYYLYAVNRETEELFVIQPFVGDNSQRKAKEAALLANASEIKEALGEDAPIKVWLEQVGEFEPIDEE